MEGPMRSRILTNPKGGRGDKPFFSNDHCIANDNNKLFKVSKLPEIEPGTISNQARSGSVGVTSHYGFTLASTSCE